VIKFPGKNNGIKQREKCRFHGKHVRPQGGLDF
jgi:hypothetical protein